MTKYETCQEALRTTREELSSMKDQVALLKKENGELKAQLTDLQIKLSEAQKKEAAAIARNEGMVEVLNRVLPGSSSYNEIQPRVITIEAAPNKKD